MRYRKPTRLCAAFFLTVAFSQMIFSRQQQGLIVPRNTNFTLSLLSPISTATNQKGDRFSCRVMDSGLFEGAIISGRITKLKRSGKAKGKSELSFAFDEITLSDGRVGKFPAQIVEVYDVINAGNNGKADDEGQVKGKSRVKRNALKIGIGVAIGAAIGGAIAGGHGAVVGAGIGALAASATTISERGPDLEFREGTQFVVRTAGR